MNLNSIPPLSMLRSFLTVASSLVLTQISYFAIALSLGYFFFPQFLQYLDLTTEEQAAMMAENPTQAIPVPMFWLIVVANSMVCMAIGWVCARTAPFAPFQHGVFLAVLLFLLFLQIVIEDPAPKKWMDLIYMAAFPIAALIGANAVGNPPKQSRGASE